VCSSDLKPRRERQKRLAKLGLDAPDVADAVRTYRKTIVDMETALETRDWIVGDAFSLADVCLAPYFQTLQQFGWMSAFTRGCPGVVTWFENCQSRASYQSGVAVDFPDAVMAELQALGEPALKKISAHFETK